MNIRLTSAVTKWRCSFGEEGKSHASQIAIHGPSWQSHNAIPRQLCDNLHMERGLKSILR